MSDLLLTNVAAPDTPASGKTKVYVDTADKHIKTKDDTGTVTDLTSGGSGEVNTASNVGTAGVGVFKQKSTYDLEFKKINAGSAKITVTDDTGNDEVDIDVGTLAASDISDFDTEVANNSAVTANTAKVTNATHSGDVTGDTVLTIASGAVDIAHLSATGTPSSSNFLRGDNQWATPAGSGDVVGPGSATDGAPVLFDGTSGTLIKEGAFGIADNNVVQMDDATAASGEICQFTAAGIKGLSESEFKAAVNLEIGTDVQGVLAEGAFVDGDKTKLDGIEASADVTDATNVATAGAIMDGDFSSNGLMKRTGAGAYGTAVEDTDYQGVLSEGAFADGDKTKLDGIEASADVTDATNVAAAGAYMLTETATAGETLVAGNVCYLKSDGKYWKTDASAAATAVGQLRIATAGISADASGVFGKPGYKYTTTGLTAADEYWMSETAGAYTATQPTTSSAIVRLIGHAESTTVLAFNPSETYIELA